MQQPTALRILTINTGSSSLKAALYTLAATEDAQAELTFVAERIGLPGSMLHIADATGARLLDRQEALPDHAAAIQVILAWLQSRQSSQAIDAIGHRIVHGGYRYSAPQLIDAEVIEALRQLIAIDPDHAPQALAVIESVSQAYPALPQIACFDTAFHRSMPRVAQLYAIPAALRDEGVIRYGFHGLSYEYILHALRNLDPAAAEGRVIIAHLGNGASMAAVQNGISIDTTMGFSPTGGLVMSTRTGDLDPGVLLYMLQSKHMTPEEVNVLVTRQAGLLAVSGLSADMRDLLEHESTNRQAAEAIALFCYQAKKFLAALAAVLGGLDTLVFTAGIGEHAAPIRERICNGLEFIGIQLDPELNARNATIISRPGSPVTVRVIPTDEEIVIAQHTYKIITQ